MLQCLYVVCRKHSCGINWNKLNAFQITDNPSLASLTRKEKIMVQMYLLTSHECLVSSSKYAFIPFYTLSLTVSFTVCSDDLDCCNL